MSAYCVPLYERQRDIDAQRAVVQAAAHAWGLGYAMAPRTFPYDALLLDGAFGSAIVEVKCRNVASTAYPTLILDVEKVASLGARARATGLPALLLVRYTDGIRWVRLDDRAFPVIVGGRTDRGDPLDVEPVVEIPVCELQGL